MATPSYSDLMKAWEAAGSPYEGSFNVPGYGSVDASVQALQSLGKGDNAKVNAGDLLSQQGENGYTGPVDVSFGDPKTGKDLVESGMANASTGWNDPNSALLAQAQGKTNTGLNANAPVTVQNPVRNDSWGLFGDLIMGGALIVSGGAIAAGMGAAGGVAGGVGGSTGAAGGLTDLGGGFLGDTAGVGAGSLSSGDVAALYGDAGYAGGAGAAAAGGGVGSLGNTPTGTEPGLPNSGSLTGTEFQPQPPIATPGTSANGATSIFDGGTPSPVESGITNTVGSNITDPGLTNNLTDPGSPISPGNMINTPGGLSASGGLPPISGGGASSGIPKIPGIPGSGGGTGGGTGDASGGGSGSLLGGGNLANLLGLLGSAGSTDYIHNLISNAGQTAQNYTNQYNTEIGNINQSLNPFGAYRNQYAQQLNSLESNPSSITSNPGYQFGMDQGEQALQRSEAAQGQLGSGASGVAIAQYGQQYAAQQLQQQEQNLVQLSGANINPSAINPSSAGNPGSMLLEAAGMQGSNLNNLLAGLGSSANTNGGGVNSLLNLLGLGSSGTGGGTNTGSTGGYGGLTDLGGGFLGDTGGSGGGSLFSGDLSSIYGNAGYGDSMNSVAKIAPKPVNSPMAALGHPQSNTNPYGIPNSGYQLSAGAMPGYELITAPNGGSSTVNIAEYNSNPMAFNEAAWETGVRK